MLTRLSDPRVNKLAGWQRIGSLDRRVPARATTVVNFWSAGHFEAFSIQTGTNFGDWG